MKWNVLHKLNNNLIFSKNLNNKYKLMPFLLSKNTIGETKYFPANSKEWKNTSYFFNMNNIKDFPIYNININKIMTSYFNLYFNSTTLLKRYVPHKLKHKSFHKIFISKPEIKHTNDKAIITIYVFNKENFSLLKTIDKLKINLLFFFKDFFFFFNLYKDVFNNTSYKTLKFLLYKNIILIRKYKLNISLNKYKFEDIFLYKLAKLINKFFGKKIEFNIINLKSTAFHADIFTELLKQKLKKKRINVMKTMNFILNKAFLSKTNSIKERSKLIKNVNTNLLGNKYKNLNLNFLVKKDNFDKILELLYNNTFFKKEYYYFRNIINNNTENFCISNFRFNYLKDFWKRKVIFNSIKHKNIGGIRLEVKGRLTKRYRADRSYFRLKWKGGLKNIDSSFKGLSVMNFRGYADSNVEYSIRNSKRRIGSFAIKGWISGK